MFKLLKSKISKTRKDADPSYSSDVEEEVKDSPVKAIKKPATETAAKA